MTPKNLGARTHPKVREAYDLVKRGHMDRREFVRVAALLGLSASAAYALAGLPSPAWAHSHLPFPRDDPNAKAGGILRVGMEVQKAYDPAKFNWSEMGNQTRHVIEYLAMTGPDNVTRPMLAVGWEASDDLKVWTFKIRQGVMWHNGEELVADHIVWNVQRWLDPALGAGGIVGLSTFAAMREDTGKRDDKGNPVMAAIDGVIEAVDRYTVRFNLKKPVLSVPEDCYNYPTAIVHPTFKAPFSDNPIGTGAFTMTELKVGERCLLKRVEKTTDGKAFKYWGGKVYLDEIHYFNFDDDGQLTALAAGDVDAIYEFGIDQMELAKSLPGQIVAAKTAQTLACRMQVDRKPFDDIRVRRAIVMSCDNTAIKALVYPDGGSVGENHLVGDMHPEYFKLPPLKRDVAGAKKLLGEAGYSDGPELTIDVGNTDGPWQQTVCEMMRDQLKEAGIKLDINVMPASEFWEIWDKTAFGAVAWTHRPLGTMVLSLAYRTGLPWNETHFASPEFDAALDDAEATLDVAQRRAKMEKVEKILQDNALMVQAIFRPVYTMTTEKVHGYPAHPAQYHQFNKVWMS